MPDDEQPSLGSGYNDSQSDSISQDQPPANSDSAPVSVPEGTTDDDLLNKIDKHYGVENKLELNNRPLTSDQVIAEQHKLLKETEQKTNEWNQRVEPYYKSYIDELRQPLPDIPQQTQYQPPPSLQQNRQSLFGKLLGFAAIAVPLAIAFGSRGGNAGWYALGALGKGIESLYKGNEQNYHDSMEQWQEQNKNITEINRQKMDMYKGILARRDMSLDQKTKMIGILGQQFGDQKIVDDSRFKNFQVIQKSLEEKEKQLEKSKEWHEKNYRSLQSELGHDKDFAEYRETFLEKHGFDPYPDDQKELSDDQLKMRHIDSFEKYKKNMHAKKKSSAPGSESDTSDGDEDPLGTDEAAGKIKGIFGQ